MYHGLLPPQCIYGHSNKGDDILDGEEENEISGRLKRVEIIMSSVCGSR